MLTVPSKERKSMVIGSLEKVVKGTETALVEGKKLYDSIPEENKKQAIDFLQTSLKYAQKASQMAYEQIMAMDIVQEKISELKSSVDRVVEETKEVLVEKYENELSEKQKALLAESVALVQTNVKKLEELL